ncbi:MAG: OmpA family protein [Bdellovibrionia bacterium]
MIKKIMLVASLVLGSLQAYSQEAIEVSGDVNEVEDTSLVTQNSYSMGNHLNDYYPESIVPFLGVGFGYMDHSNRYQTEGTPFNVKLMGSYYYAPAFLIGDVGVGIEHQSYSQDANGGVTTQAILEAAGRYEFAERISAGVILNMLTGDAQKIGSNNDQAYFWGLQIVKEFPMRAWNTDTIARVGARVSTDISIPGESVNVFMIEAAFGLPNFEKRDPYASRALPKVQPKLNQIVLKDLIKDPANAQFALNSAEVTSSQRDYLNRLATALQQNPGLVERIYVVGHADDSGSEQLNMDLSRRRAQEVAASLRQAGVASSLIQVDWKGETLPADRFNQNENRRVEVKFIGVRDEAQLDAILRSL